MNRLKQAGEYLRRLNIQADGMEVVQDGLIMADIGPTMLHLLIEDKEDGTEVSMVPMVEVIAEGPTRVVTDPVTDDVIVTQPISQEEYMADDCLDRQEEWAYDHPVRKMLLT